MTLKIQDINNQPPKFEETTKGIDVHEWKFPLAETDIQPVLVGKTPDRQKQILEKAINDGFRVNLWDFGGQEIYTATHQFFLSSRSLYLLVDAENNETTNWYDWFYQVEKLGNNSPLLIVLNKLAGRNCNIPNWAALQNIFEFVKEKYPLDLSIPSPEDEKTYHLLKGDIKRQLLLLPHIGDALPAFWTSIRQDIAEELDKLKKNREQPFITEDRFFEICRPYQEKDASFDKKAQLHMSQYFHDIGIYLHFKDDDQLRSFLFLDANWTTDLVYMLLDDTIVLNKQGRFNQSDIDRIWKDDGYRAIKGYLMNLLRHFGLAFAVEGQTQEYMTPYHLKEEKPDYVLPLEGMPLLELQYKFEHFMPKGMLPQLTVSLSEYIPDINKVWLKGAVLQFKKHQTICELVETYQKEIRIRIYGKERRETLNILMHEVEKILNRFSKLDYAEMIPCNCPVCREKALQPAFERTFFRFADLKDRLNSANADAHFVDCKWNSYRKMPIEPLLSEVFEEEKYARHFLRLADDIDDWRERKDPPAPTKPIIQSPTTTEPVNNQLTIFEKMKQNWWLILFAAAFAIFFLAWAKPGSKLDFFGWFKVEQGGNTTEATTPSRVNTVTVVGSLKINNRNAWSEDVKKVYIKNQTIGGQNTLSNNQFVLRDVEVKRDKLVEIAFDLKNGLSKSALFILHQPNEYNTVDMGEVLIEVKPPTSKNWKAGSSTAGGPTIIINNQNIQNN